MQYREIKRVVNAMKTQGRVIIHLDCGHNLSTSDPSIVPREKEKVKCTKCPDVATSAAKGLDDGGIWS